MTTTQRSKVAIEYNNGLERGRRQQQYGNGYLPPSRVNSLPEAERAAYMAGWQAGYDKTTPLSILQR